MKTFCELVNEARSKAMDDGEDSGTQNIVMQMRKVVSLRGNYDVTFDDGSKAKIDPKTAQAFLQKFNSTKRPGDKAALQKAASKSADGLKKAAKGEMDAKSDPLALKSYK